MAPSALVVFVVVVVVVAAVVAVASAPSPVAPVVVGTVAPPAVVVDTGIVPADSVPQMFHFVGCW